MSRPDILNLEWSSRGRDVDIVEPVLTRLEAHYGYSVVRESIIDYAGSIRRHKPRLFLISNQGGADINFRAVKFAAQSGCKVATMISEGDFPRDADQERIEQFFWGWNEDHVCYEDLHLEWSQGNVDLIKQHIPEAAQCDIRVSGATGFDRYSVFDFASRDEFLVRNGLAGYQRVVGVAGWTFDHVLGRYFDDHRETVLRVLGGQEDVELHRRAAGQLRDVWDEITSSMPDTAFILKHHPGVTDETHSEFFGLEGRPNVRVLRGAQENVADAIAASDVWAAYESTTCLEAWLLGKQTLLVNPAGAQFARSDLAAGSPKFTTASGLQQALRESFGGRGVPGWQELDESRSALVADKIGWGDGLNHVRAAAAIHELLVSPVIDTAAEDTPFVSDEIRRARRMRILRASGLIHLPRYVETKEYVDRLSGRFNRDDRDARTRQYATALEPFWIEHDAAIKAIEARAMSGEPR